MKLNAISVGSKGRKLVLKMITKKLTPTQVHPRLVGDYLGFHMLNFHFKF